MNVKQLKEILQDKDDNLIIFIAYEGITRRAATALVEPNSWLDDKPAFVISED